jgi:hypothetical protein
MADNNANNGPGAVAQNNNRANNNNNAGQAGRDVLRDLGERARNEMMGVVKGLVRYDGTSNVTRWTTAVREVESAWLEYPENQRAPERQRIRSYKLKLTDAACEAAEGINLEPGMTVARWLQELEQILKKDPIASVRNLRTLRQGQKSIHEYIREHRSLAAENAVLGPPEILTCFLKGLRANIRAPLNTIIIQNPERRNIAEVYRLAQATYEEIEAQKVMALWDDEIKDVNRNSLHRPPQYHTENLPDIDSPKKEGSGSPQYQSKGRNYKGRYEVKDNTPGGMSRVTRSGTQYLADWEETRSERSETSRSRHSERSSDRGGQFQVQTRGNTKLRFKRRAVRTPQEETWSQELGKQVLDSQVKITTRQLAALAPEAWKLIRAEVDALHGHGGGNLICHRIQYEASTDAYRIPVEIQQWSGSGTLDTGATISCIHDQLARELQLDRDTKTIRVETVTGTIEMDRCRTPIEIQIGDKPFLVRPLIMQYGPSVLIGRDILRQCECKLDDKNNIVTLKDDKGKTSVPLEIHQIVARDLEDGETDTRYLREFQEEIKNREREEPPLQTREEHQIVLLTGSRPHTERPRRIPDCYKEEVTNQLHEMEKIGTIRPSQSNWAAGLVIVPKKTGGVRLCVDYRPLNEQTLGDAYPLPRIDQLLRDTMEYRWFSLIDLAAGYWQIPMREECKALTAFVTPQGLYEFNVMPFGLKNAPATFQRLVTPRTLKAARSSTAARPPPVF